MPDNNTSSWWLIISSWIRYLGESSLQTWKKLCVQEYSQPRHLFPSRLGMECKRNIAEGSSRLQRSSLLTFYPLQMDSGEMWRTRTPGETSQVSDSPWIRRIRLLCTKESHAWTGSKSPLWRYITLLCWYPSSALSGPVQPRMSTARAMAERSGILHLISLGQWDDSPLYGPVQCLVMTH